MLNAFNDSWCIHADMINVIFLCRCWYDNVIFLCRFSTKFIFTRCQLRNIQCGRNSHGITHHELDKYIPVYFVSNESHVSHLWLAIKQAVLLLLECCIVLLGLDSVIICRLYDLWLSLMMAFIRTKTVKTLCFKPLLVGSLLMCYMRSMERRRYMEIKRTFQGSDRVLYAINFVCTAISVLWDTHFIATATQSYLTLGASSEITPKCWKRVS